MQLKWLELEHFRNYSTLKLDFESSPVVAFIGENAQGKTNLLESIAFLALGKSFRTHRSIDTLAWNEAYGRVKGQVGDTELEVFLQRSPLGKFTKKHREVIKPRDFLGQLRVVLFTPEHLLLISGAPRLRRQYFDRTLVQLDPLYVDALSDLERCLKQRNTILKQIAERKKKEEALEVWDQALIKAAELIWAKRIHFADYLRRHLTSLYQSIAGTKDELTLHYEPHADRFDERLVAHREADLRTGSSSLGPHRDDFLLKLNGRNSAETGSRGECRSAVLALKMAEMHFIEEKTGQKPLLLLDDVFSELDEQRQQFFGELLGDYEAVITTTALDHVKGLKKAQVYQVSQGEVLKKEA